MKKIILIFVIIILIATAMFFGYKIYNIKKTTGTQFYKDDKHGFTLNYSNDWTVNTNYGNIFLKNPTKIETVVSEKFTDKDCFFAYVVLENSAHKSLDEIFKKISTDDNGGKHVKLGDNDFLAFISSGANSITSNKKDNVTYAIMGKSSQPISFDTPRNVSCQKEVEKILASLKFL
jgi:hypothetical protein